MKKVYTTQNRVLLYLLQSTLEDKGLHCTLRNENPPLAGEIPPVIAPPEIWVMDDAHYAEAKRVIQAAIAHASQPGERWECPECHEILEGQFDVCWKCGKSKE